MNSDDHFHRRATQLLRDSADDIDGETRTRLAAARRRALDAATRPMPWLGLRHLAPAGAVAAAAVLATLLFVGQRESLPVNEQGASALYDLELLADADALELSLENDLEFIEWAAGIAQQEGSGG